MNSSKRGICREGTCSKTCSLSISAFNTKNSQCSNSFVCASKPQKFHLLSHLGWIFPACSLLFADFVLGAAGSQRRRAQWKDVHTHYFEREDSVWYRVPSHSRGQTRASCLSAFSWHDGPRKRKQRNRKDQRNRPRY